jgi:hypothetical protein
MSMRRYGFGTQKQTWDCQYAETIARSKKLFIAIARDSLDRECPRTAIDLHDMQSLATSPDDFELSINPSEALCSCVVLRLSSRRG